MSDVPPLVRNGGLYLGALNQRLSPELRQLAAEINSDPLVRDDPEASDNKLTLAELSRAFHYSKNSGWYNALYGRDRSDLLGIAAHVSAAQSDNGVHLPRPEEIEGSAERTGTSTETYVNYLSRLSRGLLEQAREGGQPVSSHTRLRLETRLEHIRYNVRQDFEANADAEGIDAYRRDSIANRYNRLVGVADYVQSVDFSSRPDLADVITLDRNSILIPTDDYRTQHGALTRLQELDSAHVLRGDDGLNESAVLRRLQSIQRAIDVSQSKAPHLDFALQRYFNAVVEDFLGATLPSLSGGEAEPFLSPSERTVFEGLKYEVALRGQTDRGA